MSVYPDLSGPEPKAGYITCETCDVTWYAQADAEPGHCPLCAGIATDTHLQAQRAAKCMMAILMEAAETVANDAPDMVPVGVDEPHPAFLAPVLVKLFAEDLQSSADTETLLKATFVAAVQAQLLPALCLLEEYVAAVTAECGGELRPAPVVTRRSFAADSYCTEEYVDALLNGYGMTTAYMLRCDLIATDAKRGIDMVAQRSFSRPVPSDIQMAQARMIAARILAMGTGAGERADIGGFTVEWGSSSKNAPVIERWLNDAWRAARAYRSKIAPPAAHWREDAVDRLVADVTGGMEAVPE